MSQRRSVGVHNPAHRDPPCTLRQHPKRHGPCRRRCREVLEACARAVADEAASCASRVFLGGRSMGGRISSHVVAEGFPAAGLVFLSYPLHRPGQPERRRDEHLPRIGAPMLFIQGSTDPFAQPDHLQQTLSRLPRATLHIVEGGDHGLRVRDRADNDVVAEIVRATMAWVAGTGRGH